MLKRVTHPRIRLCHSIPFINLAASKPLEHLISRGSRSLHSSASCLRYQAPIRTRNLPTMSADYLTQKGQPFDRAAFESLLRRKTFLWQSFEPYGAVKVIICPLCSSRSRENRKLNSSKRVFLTMARHLKALRAMSSTCGETTLFAPRR